MNDNYGVFFSERGNNGGIHQQVVKLFCPHGEQTQTQNSPALQRYVTIPAASRSGLQKGTDASSFVSREEKGEKAFCYSGSGALVQTQRVLVSAPPPPTLPFTFSPLALHNSNHLIWLISGRARDLTSKPQRGRWLPPRVSHVHKQRPRFSEFMKKFTYVRLTEARVCVFVLLHLASRGGSVSGRS